VVGRQSWASFADKSRGKSLPGMGPLVFIRALITAKKTEIVSFLDFC